MASTTSSTSTSSTLSNSPMAELQRPIGHSLPNIGVKLDNTNHLLWKTRFKPFLRAYRMLYLVEGISKCPSPSASSIAGSTSSSSLDPNVQSWVERNQVALGWILSTVDDLITTKLISCDTSHDAWTTLERNYSQQTQARVMQLQTEFSLLNKGTSSMHDYLNQAKIIVDNLAAIDRSLSPDEILSRVLIGLGPDYKGFLTALNLSGVNHTLETLYGPLLTQEASLLLDEIVSSDFTTTSPMIHLAHHPFRPNPQHHLNPSRPDQQLPLTSLLGFDHPRTTPPFSHNQRSNRGGRGTRATRCQVCNRHGHSVLTCYNRFNQNFKPCHQPPLDHSSPQGHALYAPPPSSQAGLLPLPSTSDGLHSWYPNLGATHHVTSDLANLSLRSDYSGSNQVHIGDGSGSFFGQPS